jgi:hypothetical protein
VKSLNGRGHLIPVIGGSTSECDDHRTVIVRSGYVTLKILSLRRTTRQPHSA